LWRASGAVKGEVPACRTQKPHHPGRVRLSTNGSWRIGRGSIRTGRRPGAGQA